MQSSSSVTKDNESYLLNSNSSLPGSRKEKTVDNRAANISSENKQNYNDSTCSSPAIAPIGSLPWEQREEKLRSLLGIKKEPKDVESQQDTITCAVSSKSSTVTMEGRTNRPVNSGSISSVTSLSSGSNKSSTSRYVPLVSQLSLSRPQCSFVHIDGVQCGAITWNKYCSYHQRVFQSEETNTHEQSHVSEGSCESPIMSLIGRQGSTQIFRPTTPPYDPPERFGVDGGLDAIGGVKVDCSSSYNKYDRKQEEQSENVKDDEKSSEEIDLNSTVSYTALGAATDGRHRSIDLSTTVRGPTRSLLLHGSSADVSSGPSIDLFHSVPKPRRTLELHDTTLDDTRTMDLCGTALDGTKAMDLHGTTLDDTRTSPDIDLSGTVPNLEGCWHSMAHLP
ncbi:hypothetical protein OS493_032714 [Desmophyllum pertusum]|uniref:Uncharacterized protein n=1 Tax=Desmophyllum pertusum TaxID=174260 RepID=A0A9X0D7C1_9CNID|nr:hypothetical protein OS493_032714 [Desmophyllum pertusum]